MSILRYARTGNRAPLEGRTAMTSDARPWWASPWFAAALALLMAVPLLWPSLPPLSDLPAHMGRYRLQAGTADAPVLAETFSIHWLPIGNLGVDGLVMLLGPSMGIEPATKLVVLLIPVLTAAGMLMVAAEAHGRIPPTAAFALPLAYGYPFQFGFVNYALAMALALIAFALALRLARRERWRARTMLLLAGGIVIYFAHIVGWIFLGLLCLAEAIVRRSREGGGARIGIRIVRDCLPLAVPLLFILLWRSDESGGAVSAMFDLRAKWGGIESALRDRHVAWDGDGALFLLAVAIGGALTWFRPERRLAAAAAALGLVYLLVPAEIFGLIYADMRLAPFLLALALLALGPRPGANPRVMSAVASLALVFLAARLAVTTAGYAHDAAAQEKALAALDALPRGARVAALIDLGCPRGWAPPRITIASMAIVRRDSFVNDQFLMPGAQLVRVGQGVPRDFAYQDSTRIRLSGCARPEPLLADRLAALPRDWFDHAWLLGVPAAHRPRESWLEPVWQGEDSALYRILRPER